MEFLQLCHLLNVGYMKNEISSTCRRRSGLQVSKRSPRVLVKDRPFVQCAGKGS